MINSPEHNLTLAPLLGMVDATQRIGQWVHPHHGGSGYLLSANNQVRLKLVLKFPFWWGLVAKSRMCGALSNWFPSQCSYWKDLVFVLLVMCAASGRSACQSSVKCVGYFITIGSQASAAAAKISFVDLAHFTIQTGFVGCKIWLAFKHFSSSVPLAEVEKKELPFGAFLSVEHLLYLLSSPHVEPEVRES